MEWKALALGSSVQQSEAECHCWFSAAAVEHMSVEGEAFVQQCPTVKCVTREVPEGAKGGQPSPAVAKEQRLGQEEEGSQLPKPLHNWCFPVQLCSHPPRFGNIFLIRIQLILFLLFFFFSFSRDMGFSV